ncbi:MAG TPA: hypothetical protein VND65_08605 [Candidatus Binatia bacterium]|nr:hypothetical protein [Candidatus Binatia bacterium]
MALETTFRDLSMQLHLLHDSLDALQTTIGDHPEDRGSALVDALDASVLDMLSTLHEAQTAALDAQRGVASPLDLDRTRRALMICHERVLGIGKQFANDLASYDKLWELVRLGNERGDEWLAWAGGTKEAIEECRQPLEELNRTVARCWQEIAEHAGATSVSVRTTTIGQRIVPRPAEAADLGYERVP